MSGPGAQRPGSRDLRQLRRLAGFLRPYRWQVAATLLALVLAAAAVLVFGIGLRYLIDGGFAAGRVERAGPRAQGVADRDRGARGRDLRARLSGGLARRAGGRRPAPPGLRPGDRRCRPGSSRSTRTGEVLSRLTSRHRGDPGGDQRQPVPGAAQRPAAGRRPRPAGRHQPQAHRRWCWSWCRWWWCRSW